VGGKRRGESIAVTKIGEPTRLKSRAWTIRKSSPEGRSKRVKRCYEEKRSITVERFGQMSRVQKTQKKTGTAGREKATLFMKEGTYGLNQSSASRHTPRGTNSWGPKVQPDEEKAKKRPTTGKKDRKRGQRRSTANESRKRTSHEDPISN